MDFITSELPEAVERYLRQYDDLFARREQREHFRLYVAGLISETHRKNIGQIMAKVVEGDYQSGHHFLADSPWAPDAINRRRLKLWQSDPTTRMLSSGWWLQDDTGQERRKRGKPIAEPSSRLSGGIDGVARQYIGNVGKVSEGLVFVSTHYADERKRVPVTADLFWPKPARERLPEKEKTAERKRDKIDIALDQLRWAAREENIAGRRPSGVVADAWYGRARAI
jgi:SRSO17 transposase